MSKGDFIGLFLLTSQKRLNVPLPLHFEIHGIQERFIVQSITSRLIRVLMICVFFGGFDPGSAFDRSVAANVLLHHVKRVDFDSRGAAS